MSNIEIDETRLTESLHELAARVTPSPDALGAIRARDQRHRRNRSRVTAAAGGLLAVVVGLTGVGVSRIGDDTEVSTTRTPVASDTEGSLGEHHHLPVFVSVPWLKPNHISLFEGLPKDGGDRSVQSSYRGDAGRHAELAAEHNPPWTAEERASERDGPREEVAGPRGTRITLIRNGGLYWGFWAEGEWQFELKTGQTSRDEAVEILQSVTVDAARFEELKLALRDNVYDWRPEPPPVEHVVASALFEDVEWRITELASPRGQRCLGLEPERGHRWFCIPSDAGAFTGEEPTIPPGQKVQINDSWMYVALVDDSTERVRVHTEATDGRRETLDLFPAPLRDGNMGVAVGMIPTSIEKTTTEFVDADGNVTYTTTQAMHGG